jgi:hypothetical protein
MLMAFRGGRKPYAPSEHYEGEPHDQQSQEALGTGPFARFGYGEQQRNGNQFLMKR